MNKVIMGDLLSILEGYADSYDQAWFQNPRDRMDGHSRWAPEDKRVYFRIDKKDNYASLCDAALAFMKREVGGYSDKFDPTHFKMIISTGGGGGLNWDGRFFVNGEAQSGGKKGLCIQIELNGGKPLSIPRLGVEFIMPIRTFYPLNWSVIDDVEFERLMFKLFSELDDEYSNVQWLQKTNAPDGGRDISAIRNSNGNRILIQARHQKKSSSAADVNEIVVKAETWIPKFDEVMIVTTSAFTQEAIRWTETHNQDPGNRPIVSLEPSGHLEVMLIKKPYLISHSRLR